MTDPRDTDAAEPARRGLQRWHYGKLIMLWTWGALLVTLSLYVVLSLPPAWFPLGTLLLVVAVAIPVGLSIITWKWLTGKERDGTETQ